MTNQNAPADLEQGAVEIAINAMGWTDPRMASDARKLAAGYAFSGYGAEGDCLLTYAQVSHFRSCLAGVRAAFRDAARGSRLKITKAKPVVFEGDDATGDAARGAEGDRIAAWMIAEGAKLHAAGDAALGTAWQLIGKAVERGDYLKATPQPGSGSGELDFEGLGDALFALSAQLKAAGFLADPAHHTTYERVVAEFQKLAPTGGDQ